MLTQRAYSCLEFKSVDDDKRIIEGLASTIETDRMGDIVESKGAQFTLPLPLLWQHRSDQPIGHVISATITKDGIKIRAQLAKDIGITWIEDAWKLIKGGLVRGLSIGFKAIESARIEDTFGLHFLKWEWLELSAVTIPANASASIALIKSLDAEHVAASGTGVITSKHAGVSAPLRVVSTIPKDRHAMKSKYADQIASIEASIKAKEDDREAIQTKVSTENRTKDAGERESFDNLNAEIKSLRDELKDLKDLEAQVATSATVVKGATAADGTQTRTTQQIIVRDQLPGELEFARMVLCKAASFMECSKGNFVSPLQIAQKRYPDNPRIHQYLQTKAAVAGATTTDANWASALLPAAQSLESAFLEYLRPKTIIGQFGQNGIPSLNRVPFNVKIGSQTSGATAAWVGEGKGKPVTKFNTTSTTLLFTKVAAIAVITEELARFSVPGAEGLVLRELSRAVVQRLDADFIDPDISATSGIRPASITNGLTPLTSAGVSAANALTDLQNLISPFVVAHYDVSKLVVIMPNSLALVLSLMLNSLGQRAFPDLTVNGGRLAGLPVITSQYAASGASYGNMIIVVSADDIALADDGSVSVDASREASIEMSDAPANESVTPTASAYMVSMFQTNSIALRAEREINWKKLRTNAVTFMDDVNWGSVGSPV